MRFRSVFPALVGGLLVLLPWALPAQTIRYSEISSREPTFAYIKQVLEEALAAGDPAQKAQLVADPTSMTQDRALLFLKDNKNIDLFWTMTSAAREEGVLPVRFPLLRGMLGQRLIIIRKGEEGRFAGVKTAQDLAAFPLGQGIDWPDATIMEKGGLKVVRSPNYTELMKMLTVNRFDGFPLGANEVWDEIAKRPELAVSVEPRLLISYPAPFYFFVAPGKPELAARLEKGLAALAASGRFVALFNQNFEGLIAKAQLSKRTVIKLDNPTLSPASKAAMEKWKSLLLVQ